MDLKHKKCTGSKQQLFPVTWSGGREGFNLLDWCTKRLIHILMDVILTFQQNYHLSVTQLKMI